MPCSLPEILLSEHHIITSCFLNPSIKRSYIFCLSQHCNCCHYKLRLIITNIIASSLSHFGVGKQTCLDQMRENQTETSCPHLPFLPFVPVHQHCSALSATLQHQSFFHLPKTPMERMKVEKAQAQPHRRRMHGQGRMETPRCGCLII